MDESQEEEEEEEEEAMVVVPPSPSTSLPPTQEGMVFVPPAPNSPLSPKDDEKGGGREGGKEGEEEEDVDLASFLPSYRLRNDLQALLSEQQGQEGREGGREEEGSEEIVRLLVMKAGREGGREGGKTFRAHAPVVCARSAFIKTAVEAASAVSSSSLPASPSSLLVVPLAFSYAKKGWGGRERGSEGGREGLPPPQEVFGAVLSYLYTDDIGNLGIDVTDRYLSSLPPSLPPSLHPALLRLSLIHSLNPFLCLTRLSSLPPSLPPSLSPSSSSDAVLVALPSLEALLCLSTEMGLPRLFSLVESQMKQVGREGGRERGREGGIPLVPLHRDGPAAVVLFGRVADEAGR
jgi:hypothetical protein